MDLNKVMLIGRLSRDPELRNIPDGTAVANFGLATNRVYKDRSGNRQQTVEFHEIVTWRRLAEIAAQYLRRGGKVYIEGRMQTRSWDDPNGFKRYRTEIVADNLIMLDRLAGGGNNAEPAPSVVNTMPGPADYNRRAAVTNMAPTALPASPSPAPVDRTEDDIPVIDISEESGDEAEVSVEDIPF